LSQEFVRLFPELWTKSWGRILAEKENPKLREIAWDWYLVETAAGKKWLCPS
jgi:hypothetical protein